MTSSIMQNPLLLLIQDFQLRDTYSLLSDEVKYSIFDDWHSFVLQYVMKSHPSEESEDVLLRLNTHQPDIDENKVGAQMVAYRTQVLSSLGERAEYKFKQLEAEHQNLLSAILGRIEEERKQRIDTIYNL